MFVHTDGYFDCLRAELVTYKDAVFSRILHADIVDSDGAAFGLFGDGVVVLVDELPVVTKPEALWCRVPLDEACQAQRLRRECEILSDRVDWICNMITIIIFSQLY